MTPVRLIFSSVVSGHAEVALSSNIASAKHPTDARNEFVTVDIDMISSLCLHSGKWCTPIDEVLHTQELILVFRHEPVEFEYQLTVRSRLGGRTSWRSVFHMCHPFSSPRDAG